MVLFISTQMLRGRTRQYIIDKVKRPLLKAIVILAKDYPKHKKFLEKSVVVLAKRLPDPTRENILLPNTRKLFDIRDKFFEYFVFEDEAERKAFEAIWKIVICEYEHDPYYRYRIDFIIEYIIEMGWNSELPIEYNLSILIATRDKFFEYEGWWKRGKRYPSSRDALFRAMWGIFIYEYRHNPRSRRCINWAIGEMVEVVMSDGWKPRPVGRPSPFWTEPDPHGIYEGRKFKQYIGKL